MRRKSSVSDPLPTPRRLVEAARDLLLEGGLPAVSMRQVAALCGVSATAIYRHFADKDALLAAAVIDGSRTFSSYLLRALAGATPLARFRRLGEGYFAFALENPQDYRLIFMTDCKQLALPGLDEQSQKELDGAFQMLQDRILECQSSGAFLPGEVRTLAAYVWASVHGLASLCIGGQLGPEREQLLALTTFHLDRIEASLRA